MSSENKVFKQFFLLNLSMSTSHNSLSIYIFEELVVIFQLKILFSKLFWSPS